MPNIDVTTALQEFAGNPQQAGGIAEFLGFQAITNPVDQLADPAAAALAAFFGSQQDYFGVKELYRAGRQEAVPAAVGLWIAVMADWGRRSGDRDRARRRISRALVEHVPERRNLAILTPPAGDRSREIELLFPRIPTAAGEASGKTVTSIRALINLDNPTRFHRDLLRDLQIKPGATLADLLARWQEQFSVERVANRFYQEYAAVRNRIADALRQANRNHPVIATLSQDEGRAWATRQMGRILFLWFLQAKGWLGAPNGQGSPTYLRDLYAARQETAAGEYYRGLLLPLFFDAMATGSAATVDHPQLGFIPYLNGGLFRRNSLEDRIDDAGPVSLPDTVFDPADNDSLLGLLSRYRFTTQEATPDDQSVDPDPELLGRVFENLYQGDERHDTGTYYTPREIVHFMCREVLDGYLRDEVPGLPADALDALRRRGGGMPEDDEKASPPLDGVVADSLVDALETARICDPAVGSGAFLLGMMQEMTLLHRGLLLAKPGGDLPPEERYDAISRLKRKIIVNNLHGVDLNPEAVEICRLRLWLSMVLDIEEPPHANENWALPNLDFRIVAGDSLLDRAAGIAFKESWPTPPALQIGLDLQNRLNQLERTIAQRKTQFDQTQRDPQELRRLRDLIARDQREILRIHIDDALSKAQEQLQLRQGIKGGKNSAKKAQEQVAQLQSLLDGVVSNDFALVQKPLLWPIAFPEVLREGNANSGFDIVIGNPPYVRQEKMAAAQKDGYGAAFPEVHGNTVDLYVYFYARALQIMRPGGWLSFITSNSFTKRDYGKGLRNHLANNVAIRNLIDFGETQIFDAAVEPYVLTGRKSAPAADTTVAGYNLYPQLAQGLGRSAGVAKVREGLSQLPELLTAAAAPFRQTWLQGGEWRIETEETLSLFHRLMNMGKPLLEFADQRIYFGIKTGFNDAFVIDAAKRDALIAADPRSAEVIKPWLKGSDIKPWKAIPNREFLIAIQNSGDADAANPWAGAGSERAARAIFANTYPAIYNHLRGFEDKLRPREDQGKFWWELRSCKYYYEFAEPKIIWPQIGRKIRFAFDDTGVYPSNLTYIMPTDSPWLLAVLNSSLMEFLLCQITNTLPGGFTQLGNQYISRVPIIVPQGEMLTDLNQAVAEILAGPGDARRIEELGWGIDAAVFALYELSAGERRLALDWLCSRGEALGAAVPADWRQFNRLRAAFGAWRYTVDCDRLLQELRAGRKMNHRPEVGR